MKSILHISSPNSWRGGERQIANLMLTLQTKVNQTVLCPKGSPLANFCKLNNLNYIELPKTNSLNLTWAKKIKLICEEQSISIVHVHDSKAHTFATFAKLIYNNKATILVSRRVIFPIKTSLFTRYKYTNDNVDRIICISKIVEDVVLNSYPNAKTAVIKSSINIDKYKKLKTNFNFREKYQVPKTNFIVAYVAALSKEKDHLTFIKTANELFKRYENVTFFIIGDGKEKDIIKTQIKNYNLEKRIILTGFVSDIDSIIPQIDLLLFTSVSEGLGSSILDFFLAKKPVVSTKCGGPEEIITHNKNGMLAPIGDYKMLATHVLTLINDEDLKNKIVENAYDYIVKNHSLAQLGDKTLTIYNDEYIEPKAITKNKLTAIIPTLNEENNIEEAIKNVLFADEVLIIDSFSTDKTIALAKKYDVTILQRKFDNFSAQKNYAIDQAKNDWILILDADERIPKSAINEIVSVLNSNTNVDAFWMNRQNFFLKEKVYFSGWQNDKIIRLFNKQKARYDGKFVHEEVLCTGKEAFLKNKLLHYTYNDEEEYKNKIILYAKLRAKELYDLGIKPTFYHSVIKSRYRFLFHYVLKLGFLDGKKGWIIASINAYGVKKRFEELIKLYEKSIN